MHHAVLIVQFHYILYTKKLFLNTCKKIIYSFILQAIKIGILDIIYLLFLIVKYKVVMQVAHYDILQSLFV
jgi:hypothetical protein